MTPPAPAYGGVFERADCSQISGYAYDNDAPELTISVDIYADFKLIAIVPADRFRRDLSFAGWANPYHGFLFPTPNSLKDGKTHQITVTFAGTGIGLSGNPKFIACNASIFPTAVPDAIAPGGGKTWEQGVEFSSSLSGIITRVRFWRAAEEPPGGHTARILTASGTLLKTAPFSETSAGAGWQYATVNLPITAGVRYRVTYNINYVGAKTWNVFNNGPITEGPLTAWSSWLERLLDLSRPDTAPATFSLISHSTHLDSEIEELISTGGRLRTSAPGFLSQITLHGATGRSGVS